MAGWCGSSEWVAAFVVAHGRGPNAKDLADCNWSVEWAAQEGRSPTQEDWERHYYEAQGLPVPGEERPKKDKDEEGLWPKAGELLGALRFPYAEEMPPFMRDWGRYFQDLLAQNPEVEMPLPFAPLEEGEAETEWYTTMKGVAEMLGLSQLYEERKDRDATVDFQAFVDAVSKAPFEAQQRLISLRYSPEAGWHSIQVPQIPHPEYL